MSKLYKIFFIIIVSTLVILNIVFLLYNKEIVNYFQFSSSLENPSSIIERVEEETLSSFFDLNRLSSPKFVNLKEFQIDLTGFSLPGELTETDSSTITEDPFPEDPLTPVEPSIDLPIFEVGNDNPFNPANLNN